MRRDLIALPDDSKVWIYQADEMINYDTSEAIRNELYDFTMNWKSHGHELSSYANLFHHRFLVIVADSSSLPSGCSIDASVHLVQDIGSRHKIDFFDRLTYAFMLEDELSTMPSVSLKGAYNQGDIHDESLVFDNLVNTKADFLENWIKPLKDSWHYRFLK